MFRYCLKCGKAQKACICSWISNIETSVQLIILQHPTEVNRAKGTAKILTLSLANSVCLVGEDFSNHVQLNQLLAEKNTLNFVLFPSDGAEVVTSELVTKMKANAHTKVRILLLDGTWKKAFKMYQLSGNLHGLPNICLPQDISGNYKIRKAPKENSLSTVEAGYQVLKIMEPNTNFEPLVFAFNAMVDFYIQQLPDGVFERNYDNN